MAELLSRFGVKSKFIYLVTLTWVLFCSECPVSVISSTSLGIGLQSDHINVVYEVTNVHSTDNVFLSRLDTTMAYAQAIEYIYEDNVWSDLFNYVQNIDQFINLTNYRFTALSFLFPLNHFNIVQKVLTEKSAEKLVEYDELKLNSLILFVRESRSDGPSDCFWEKEYFEDLRLDSLTSIKEQSQKINSSLHLGLEYLNSLIKYCRDENFEILSLVNFTVLKIVYTPQNDLFSYGMFAESLDVFIPQNREFVRAFNSNCTLYIRIIFINEKVESQDINNRYKALLAEYITTWAKENDGDEIFIIEVYPINIKLSSNLELLKSHVSPQFGGLFDNPKASLSILEETGCAGTTNLCENKQMISIISHTFRQFQFSTEQAICSQLSKRCFNKDITNKGNLLNSTTYLFENYEANSSKHQQQVQKLGENGKDLNLQTIYFSNPNSSWNTSEWNQTFLKLLSKNINVGGYVQIIEDGVDRGEENPIGEAFSKIGRLFFQATEILLHLRIDLDITEILPKLLLDLQSAQRLYNKYYFKLNFVVAITLESNPSGLDPAKEAIFSGTQSQPTTVKGALSLYCDKFAKRINELYEAVLTHANVNKWKNFHLRNAVSLDGTGSWWLSVDTSPEYFDRRITNYPLLVRTNAAKPLHKDQQLPNTFPCIEWTTKSVETGIRFLDNNFVGTTVHMQLRESRLNPMELETMLLYALGKFGSAELLVKNKQDLDNIAAVVFNERFTNISHRQRGPLIYINLPISMAFENQFFNYSSEKVFWHFYGWEYYKSNKSISAIPDAAAAIKTLGSQIGLTVEDCGYEINTNFTTLKNISLISDVSFLVCQTKPFVPNNRNPTYMAEYLHTLYYIKNYIETFLPQQVKILQNLKVHFRLNLTSEQSCRNIAVRDRIENYLRFLNDVNQHSSAYEIHYFIEAFEKQNKSDKCFSSWWHLKNYKDLTNTSVFIDKEEEHFGRPTKLLLQLPPLPPLEENVKIQESVTQTVIFSVVSFLFIVALAVIFLRWWQTRRQYLDKKEISNFYNGNLDNDTADGSKWLGIPFPKSYEIPSSNIEFGDLIGSGEFGKVYHGKLNEELDVAIKLPEPKDSKESFKGTLAEVKILCYLANGQHPNIVLFIGAYTREIQNGKLYILTEFCSNGSLQDYLRSSKEEFVNAAIQLVGFYKLFNFAYEIASGMKFISDKRVVHGDLAARNVFLNADLTCKIGDFGLSRKLYELNEYVKKSQEPLPWRWMAIESLKHMEFTTKSDVWSYGVTVWEIFSLGDIPFPGLSWNAGFVNDLEKGLRMKKARYASEDIQLKLMSCWDSVADDRPTFSELIEFFATKKETEYEHL